MILFSFYTPWKHQETFDRKCEWNGMKQIKKLTTKSNFLMNVLSRNLSSQDMILTNHLDLL